MMATGVWTGLCSAAALAGFLVGATVPLPTPEIDAHALQGPTIVMAQPLGPHPLASVKPKG